MHNGIQRVVREVVGSWWGDHPLVLGAWTSTAGTLRTLAADEQQRVVEWGRHDGHGRPGDGPPPVRDDVTELLIPWHTTVVLAEVPLADRCPQLAALAQYSGNDVVLIGYDAIPFVSADLRPLGEPTGFAQYLAVVKYATPRLRHQHVRGGRVRRVRRRGRQPGPDRSGGHRGAPPGYRAASAQRGTSRTEPRGPPGRLRRTAGAAQEPRHPPPRRRAPVAGGAEVRPADRRRSRVDDGPGRGAAGRPPPARRVGHLDAWRRRRRAVAADPGRLVHRVHLAARGLRAAGGGVARLRHAGADDRLRQPGRDRGRRRLPHRGPARRRGGHRRPCAGCSPTGTWSPGSGPRPWRGRSRRGAPTRTTSGTRSSRGSAS